jgi:cbb3-type cytochrome oxidase subunit 3
MSQTIRLVILVVIFVGIVAWAFARRRQRQFERDARIPFRDDGGRSPP